MSRFILHSTDRILSVSLHFHTLFFQVARLLLAFFAIQVDARSKPFRADASPLSSYILREEFKIRVGSSDIKAFFI